MKNEYLINVANGKYTYLSCPKCNYKINNNIYNGYNCTCLIKDYNYTFAINKYKINITIIIEDKIDIKPSYNGLLYTYNKNNLKGVIKHPKELFLRCNNRFIALMISNQIPALLINPLLGYNNDNGKMITCNYSIINETTIEFELISKHAKKLLFEIYSYTQKLIFDNMIENKRTDRNNVFTSVAFLENIERQEELMIRFNYIKIAEILGKQVTCAFLYMKILSKSNYLKLQINEIEALWCSFGTTWVKKPNSILDNSLIKIVNDYIKIDVTKYIKFFSDKININHPGFIIKVLQGNIQLVTADSYYYPTILEIYTK